MEDSKDTITGNYFGAWLLYHACCFALWPCNPIFISQLISYICVVLAYPAGLRGVANNDQSMAGRLQVLLY